MPGPNEQDKLSEELECRRALRAPGRRRRRLSADWAAILVADAAEDGARRPRARPRTRSTACSTLTPMLAAMPELSGVQALINSALVSY